MAYRVFVSHAWADLWVAKQIERRIKELGGDTFIDVYDVVIGDVIEAQVFEALPSCKEIIVLFTPWSVERNWLWTELGAARALGLSITAVLYRTTLDEIDQRHGGTTFLRSRNVVDINTFDDYLDQLRHRIAGG